MEAKSTKTKPWEALPMPKGWRTMGEVGEKVNGENEILLEEIWSEWMASHPLEGG
ncbi:hypothetical protein K9M78_05850 [Candidatus Bipolaricaulota bacterium]|nr:hypothetical protein [Candidatus Bipolaricaulota bacterium]